MTRSSATARWRPARRSGTGHGTCASTVTRLTSSVGARRRAGAGHGVDVPVAAAAEPLPRRGAARGRRAGAGRDAGARAPQHRRSPRRGRRPAGRDPRRRHRPARRRRRPGLRAPRRHPDRRRDRARRPRRRARPALPAPEQTSDSDLSVIAPGETVLARGLGLAFVDLVVLLFEGRGGRFVADPDDTDADRLRYEPCGREPVLVGGSPRGATCTQARVPAAGRASAAAAVPRSRGHRRPDRLRRRSTSPPRCGR